MCCILACLFNHPTFGLVEDIGVANRDGMGVAWIDPTTGKIRWRKGLDELAVFQLTQTLPFPYVVHARMATVGDPGPALTHPFTIEHKPSLKLEGESDSILMHNGHVSEWRELAKAAGLQIPKEKPRGWSDTRAVASAVNAFGTDLLETLSPSRFALLSVENGLKQFGEWLDVSDGIEASSDPKPWFYDYNYGCGYSYKAPDKETEEEEDALWEDLRPLRTLQMRTHEMSDEDWVAWAQDESRYERQADDADAERKIILG